MSDFTDAAMMLRMAYQAMEKTGIDANKVLQHVGMSYAKLNEEGLRTPHAMNEIIWEYLEELTGDPEIGLHIGQNLPPFRGECGRRPLRRAAAGGEMEEFGQGGDRAGRKCLDG